MAATRKRSSKKPSRKRGRASVTSWEPVTIGEQDVLLLQVAAGVDLAELEDLVFQKFQAAAQELPTTPWLAFAFSDRPHYAGQSTWIGFSRSTPQRVVDAVQHAMERGDLDVSREMCRVPNVPMLPFARLSPDGLEILVPAALAGDPAERRSVRRGGVDAWARGYRLGASKSAALQALFFGSED